MPVRDAYHDAVKNGLIKDGWQITNDPLVVTFGNRNLYVDLGAEAPINAEKQGRKIAVEVKSFLTTSEITEFERAIGEYVLYRFLIDRREPERMTYLAVSFDVFRELFDIADGRDFMTSIGMKLIVFNPESEELVKWIS